MTRQPLQRPHIAMSHKITYATLWNVKPMIAFLDPRCAIYNDAGKKELVDAGIGGYIHEIKDCYFTLVGDFEEPSTLVQAFKNWMAEHPNDKLLHIPEIACCPIKYDEPSVRIDMIELLEPHMPKDMRVVFYREKPFAEYEDDDFLYTTDDEDESRMVCKGDKFGRICEMCDELPPDGEQFRIALKRGAPGEKNHRVEICDYCHCGIVHRKTRRYEDSKDWFCLKCNMWCENVNLSRYRNDVA